MRDIVMLKDLRASDAGLAGAKAANLGELISVGIPVPNGFCLLNSVYDSTAAPVLWQQLDLFATQLTDEQLMSAAASLRGAVETIAVPAPLLAELEQAYHAVRPAHGAVVVRSSGTLEDSETASFAGQYHTELAVRSLDDVVAAVKRCWASLWDVHAIRYRERVGVLHTRASMAVIVQAMVPAQAAGVMFTAGVSDDRVVIESSWGYGEAVVNGLVTPDRFEVSRANAQVENIELARKMQMVVPSLKGTGTVLTDLAPERQTMASLTREQASELAAHGLAIEAHFGRPQDVEWAIANSDIAILQARPLSYQAKRSEFRWESPIEGAWWARISICDSWLPEPLSPLFATTLFPCLVKRWMENWAGPESEHDHNPLLPKPMAGTINGFAYLRIDFPMNKYPFRTAKLVLNFFRFHLGRLGKRWRTQVLPRHVDRLEAMRRLDLPRLDTTEVFDLIDEAQDLTARYWAILGGLAWYWNGGEWLLERAYRVLTGSIDLDGEKVPGHGVLLQGYSTKTFETDVALYELARAGEGDSKSAHRFGELLTQYGHQVFQLDFVEATPGEDPSTFTATIEAYRDGRLQDPRERVRSLAQRREATQTQIDFALRGSMVKRTVLHILLRWNRRYAQVRDLALFYLTLAWPLIRRAYLELGQRLVQAGGLESSVDAFYLTGDELRAELKAVTRGHPPRKWAETVRERRLLREEQKLLTPPAQVPESMRLFMGPLDVTALALLGQSTSEREGPGLNGSAVSPGRVRARARHISTVKDFEKLKMGEVLVAPYITPAWSPLLAIAGGVVTDAGGALSHGSIVVREYGIPAVMGTNNATKMIQDGQIVTVDGNRGLVY